jgi:HD-like signal output (HDOD) protein
MTFALTASEPTELLEQLERAINDGSVDLPPLPSVAAEIASKASDPDASATSLAALIQRDPVLAGHIMRVANSAAYGARSPIVSLQQAIAWLGMGEIQQVAFALCIKGEVFSAPGHEKEVGALWKESLATALWAKEISRLKRRNVETAYLSGLLHRVGYAAAIQFVSRAATNGLASLTEFLGLAEPLMASALVVEWRLPPTVADAVLHWPDPVSVPSPGPEPLVTHVAHALATVQDGEELAIREGVLDALNLYADELDSLRERADSVEAMVASL